MDELIVGGIYEYKGRRYTVESEAEMQIGQLWIECVVYKTDYNTQTYVRELQDFLRKFKIVHLPA